MCTHQHLFSPHCESSWTLPPWSCICHSSQGPSRYTTNCTPVCSGATPHTAFSHLFRQKLKAFVWQVRFPGLWMKNKYYLERVGIETITFSEVKQWLYDKVVQSVQCLWSSTFPSYRGCPNLESMFFHIFETIFQIFPDIFAWQF